jgi:hypothetical protein
MRGLANGCGAYSHDDREEGVGEGAGVRRWRDLPWAPVGTRLGCRGVLLYEVVRQNLKVFATPNFRWLVVLFDRSGRTDRCARERVVSLIGSEHVGRLELLLAEALRCLDHALTLESSANTYLWRGMLRRDTGELESAELDRRRALATADGDFREVVGAGLESLAGFGWDHVRRQVMSSGWAYLPIAPRYGKKVARISSAIGRKR